MNLRKVHKYKVTHSRVEERKYVSNVLKVNGYTKTSSVTAENQLQLVALPMRGNQRLVLLLFPTFRVLRNPSREFWIATTLKLLKNLFRLWSIFLPNLRTLKEQRTDAIYSIPCNDCDNGYIGQTSLVHVWKSIKKRFFFLQKRKFSFIGAHMPNQPYNWVG